jgi:hypothetical protein
MLINIGMNAFNLVALLIGLGVSVNIGGAKGIGIMFWQHFLQIRTPNREIVSMMKIMAAGDVKVQCDLFARICSSFLRVYLHQTLFCIWS